MLNRLFYLCTLILLSTSIFAQRDFYMGYSFDHADTLRGMLRPERTAFDVHFYELDIKVDVEGQALDGHVNIHYHAVEDFDRLQLDLYRNMKISKVAFNGKELEFERDEDAVFINFPPQEKGTNGSFKVYYNGIPRVARQPPWDGGFVWTTDSRGKPWVGVACEGDGASLWWPNKDHLSDEPDSMAIRVSVPKGLTCIANGNLQSVNAKGDYNQFNWFVGYPINNYNVTVNIAAYAHFTDTYTAKDGSELAMDYYVLQENEEKAKKHFKQSNGVLEAFEHFFGKYPFWQDGFALVETPYLGMEHQSAIAYGNRYRRGYLGGMIPRDMNWDYIIVHETGHEYFGNSISCHDLAEMWIHESFTTYMEALYVEYHYSKKDAIRYLISQRPFISNTQPIIGPKDVNWEDWTSSDHYFKGSWVLHTLRSVIDNDQIWFDILKGFYQKYKISNIHSEDFFNYVKEATGKDYSAFFEQYLYHPSLPTLQYKIKNTGDDTIEFSYRWDASVENFDMPVKVGNKEEEELIFPTTQWKNIKLNTSKKNLSIRKDLFLINSKELMP